jgi:hypothetical protein
MQAYEQCIDSPRPPRGNRPWFVVPADDKWFTRIVVGSAIVHTLKGLDLELPKTSKERRKELQAAKEALLKEQD